MLLRYSTTWRIKAIRSCLALAVIFSFGRAAGAQEIHWRTDYNSARKEAAQKGLPLILDFGTQNCFWCRKLDESTFRDPAVVQVITQKYVPLRIEAERDPALVQTLRITAYPTVILAATDGKILGTIEGFQDAVRFHDNLQRALAAINNPEWMVRDYQLAAKAVEVSDYARAVALLKSIGEDGKDRPIQLRAGQLLKTLESQAAARLADARQLQARGQTAQALDQLTAMVRTYAGTQAAGEAGQLLTRLAGEAEIHDQQRTTRARELLAQAQQDYHAQQYLGCLDRCHVLSTGYGDLPEATEAARLAAEIKIHPQWMQQACDNLSERLSGLYLDLAETWIRKGQLQQAQVCLERVIQTFPGSRQAEAAQNRLGQLQGLTARRAEFQKN
jgi:thioredoxin-related protein